MTLTVKDQRVLNSHSLLISISWLSDRPTFLPYFYLSGLVNLKIISALRYGLERERVEWMNEIKWQTDKTLRIFKGKWGNCIKDYFRSLYWFIYFMFQLLIKLRLNWMYGVHETSWSQRETSILGPCIQSSQNSNPSVEGQNGTEPMLIFPKITLEPAHNNFLNIIFYKAS
jgi:hypothetical protein